MTDGTTNAGRQYLQPAFLWSGSVLLIVVFIRTTMGIDLTDEMQYYGQIKGLLETGKLFSNDLFIQQSVYILLYPLFLLYNLVFAYDGLVFFGRLLMSFMCIGIYIYAYRKFLDLAFPPIVSSLTSLSLIFAVSYHGIFAPSYNTISQALWIVFAIRFLEWKPDNAASLALIPVIAFFAHPTSAVVISLVIFFRLLVERKFKEMSKIVVYAVAMSLVTLPVIFYLAEPQQYLASLAFSSGYGVGFFFFSSVSQQIILSGVFALFCACWLSRNYSRLHHVATLVPIANVVALFILLSGFAGGAYTDRVVILLAIPTALAYAWILSDSSNTELRNRCHWLVGMLLVYAATLAITSGNGLPQATGAFMVGLPLLTGIAVSRDLQTTPPGSVLRSQAANSLLVLILMLAHWCKYPYREDVLRYTSEPIQTVPAFRFIKSSPERVQFFTQMQSMLAPPTEGLKTLIISEYPALYMVLDVHAETCMLYMHTITSEKSEQVLRECLEQKSPELIIDIVSNRTRARPGSQIKGVMYDFIRSRGFQCDTRMTSLVSRHRLNETLQISVCRKPAEA